MSINLLETIQQDLSYPALQKIDPNTQQVTVHENKPEEDKFSQAAIPAMLTGLYKYVQSDKGAEEILRGSNSTNWAGILFDDNKKEAIQKIAAYAKQSAEDPVAKLNAIVNEAIKIMRENLPKDAGIADVKLFFGTQKNNILLYLPAALNMGELLNDTTLDDKTNKMEGPVSSLIQSIGAAFSKPVMDEEINTPHQ